MSGLKGLYTTWTQGVDNHYVFYRTMYLLRYQIPAMVFVVCGGYYMTTLPARHVGACIAVALLYDCYSFVNIHTMIHNDMLYYYKQGLITHPHAFFHHYVDRSMYTKRSYQYLMDGDLSVLIGQLWMYVLNVHPLIRCMSFVFIALDLLVHSYYHNGSGFKSVNPLSVHWCGLPVMFSLFETIGMINRKEHNLNHHKEVVSNMHLTVDWVDLKYPVIAPVVDFIGNGIFAWYKFGISLVYIGPHDSSKANLRFNPTITSLIRMWVFCVPQVLYLLVVYTSLIMIVPGDSDIILEIHHIGEMVCLFFGVMVTLCSPKFGGTTTIISQIRTCLFGADGVTMIRMTNEQQ